MQDLNDKVTGGTLTAVEWNEVPSELQNVIENTGQALTSSDLNQLGKAMAQYSSNGDFYTDSGVADAYVLSTIGLKQSTPAYVDGMRVRVEVSNPNTGASTVNVDGLGVKSIKMRGGDDPSAGLIIGSVTLSFDSTNDWLELQSQAITSAAADKKNWQTIANGSDADHDIDFSSGIVMDSVGSSVIFSGSTITKQLDAAWAEGTNLGGLFSGSVASNTTYHCFVIVKDSDGTVDAGFDTDPDAANIPSGWTSYRRIHDMETDGSSNIKGFEQAGDHIILDEIETVIDTGSPGSGQFTVVAVPTGPKKVANASIRYGNSSTTSAALGSVSQDLSSPSSIGQLNVGPTTGTAQIQMDVPTDSSGQIKYSTNFATATVFKINLFGWSDDRSE